MHTRNHERSPSNREAKKAIVLGAPKKNPVPIILAIAFALALTAGAGLYLVSPRPASSPTPTNSAVASEAVDENRIAYAVSLFDDGQARHFHYADSRTGTTINYFILKSSDGVIRAAFDACDVCWRAGKGYVQEGASMICRNCGRRFESVRVNEVQGGCNPAPLKRTIEGDQVVIRVDDLRKGASYFNFSPKA
jgi:uncharacterized membrane protein